MLEATALTKRCFMAGEPHVNWQQLQNLLSSATSPTALEELLGGLSGDLVGNQLRQPGRTSFGPGCTVPVLREGPSESVWLALSQ